MYRFRHPGKGVFQRQLSEIDSFHGIVHYYLEDADI